LALGEQIQKENIMPGCQLFSPNRFNIISDIFAKACDADAKGLGDGIDSDKSKFYDFVTETVQMKLEEITLLSFE
jgi:hypothetical protein